MTTSRTNVWDLRSTIIVGFFILTFGIGWMIYQKPALLNSQAFIVLSSAIVITGLGTIVSWAFGGTKTGSDVMTQNAQTLADQASPSGTIPGPQH